MQGLSRPENLSTDEGLEVLILGSVCHASCGQEAPCTVSKNTTRRSTQPPSTHRHVALTLQFCNNRELIHHPEHYCSACSPTSAQPPRKRTKAFLKMLHQITVFQGSYIKQDSGAALCAWPVPLPPPPPPSSPAARARAPQRHCQRRLEHWEAGPAAASPQGWSMEQRRGNN